MLIKEAPDLRRCVCLPLQTQADLKKNKNIKSYFRKQFLGFHIATKYHMIRGIPSTILKQRPLISENVFEIFNGNINYLVSSDPADGPAKLGARRVMTKLWSQDDVTKWKHFPRYWPFVWGIHRRPVNSPHKGPVTRSFDVFFDLHLIKRLSRHWWGWWIETLTRPLWRHCNARYIYWAGACKVNTLSPNGAIDLGQHCLR